MAIIALLCDFSRTLVFPKDSGYQGDLNPLNLRLKSEVKDYHAPDYFELNHQLLEYLRASKNRFKLYIFTTGLLQEEPGIAEYTGFFDGIFCAEELGLSKADPQSYKSIARMMGFAPGQVLFLDDKRENVEAAK